MNDGTTVQDQMLFFEGTEKKVELVVDDRTRSLRGFGDEFWERIVSASGACVLSKTSNAHCEAYLLSESSLFVFARKMVMITCGRTRLLDAICLLLETVSPEAVELLVYERKNEVYPHRQPSSFHEDAARLHAVVPGRAFQFGEEDEHHILLYHLDRPYRCGEPDTTVELLMHGIDDEIGRRFAAGARPADLASLRELLPGFCVDDHLFQPSGYSLNAIRDATYWTLHVTPQARGSYVSFETNYRFGDELQAVAGRLIELFRPRSFDLLVFYQGEPIELAPGSYLRKSRVAQSLSCGYEVGFTSFFRPARGVERPAELPVERLEDA